MHLPLESYYRIPGLDENNIALNDQALVVNCCGRLAMDHPFVTKSPRGRNDFYLLYMWSGSMRFRCHSVKQRGEHGKTSARKQEWRQLAPGDMVLLPPQTAYFYESLTNEVMYYWIHFTGNFALDLVQAISPTTAGASPGLHDSIEASFAELFTNFIMRDELFDIANHSLLMNILWGLARGLRQKSTIDHRRAKIATSLQFIHRNIAQNIRIDTLAEMEHLSPSRYRAIFRAGMGCSPSDYIISQRIHHACELMEHFDLTIAEVAAAVGYNDPLYFSRLFKKKMNMSPTSYLGRILR